MNLVECVGKTSCNNLQKDQGLIVYGEFNAELDLECLDALKCK